MKKYLSFIALLALVIVCMFQLDAIHDLNIQVLQLNEQIVEAMKKPPEIHHHYLLPNGARCAVKEMFFADSNGGLIKGIQKVCELETGDKSVKTLCHWPNGK